MSNARIGAGMFLVALALSLSPSSIAQSDWDPLTGVSQIVSWFTKLNEQVDKVVATERKGQLIRAVDRLRRDLYALEGNAVILRDTVPDERPNAEQRQYLHKLSRELLEVVSQLGESVRAVGAEVRLNEAEAIESALTYGLRTRALTLTQFQRAIDESAAGKWNATDVKARLQLGIDAVKAAQLAATKFRRDLDRKSS